MNLLKSGHSLTVDFNMDVRPESILNGLSNSDLTLEKLTTDANVPASSIVLDNSSPQGNHGIFSFTGITGSIREDILANGNYRASISKQEVVAGTAEMPEFLSMTFFTRSCLTGWVKTKGGCLPLATGPAGAETTGVAEATSAEDCNGGGGLRHRRAGEVGNKNLFFAALSSDPRVPMH